MAAALRLFLVPLVFAPASIARADSDSLWKFLHLRSDALWQVVHYVCVVDQARIHNPTPCRYVSPRDGRPEGYAILKDRIGVRQFLLVPTDRLTGIESPDLLLPGRTGYWAQAWDSRRYLESLLGNAVPRDGIGLAVNSAVGRTQNQLHIHIDCIRPDVRALLKAHERQIHGYWTEMRLPPHNHVYAIRRLDTEDLSATNPFRIVADRGPDQAGNMAIQTIVVLGAVFRNGRDGFYLLNDQVNIGADDPATGEELLDHECSLLNPHS
jgi:CDP-diacylglycerol pyrophosphatase